MNLLSALLNPDINYQNLIIVIVLWFVALWLMFCLWVYIDSQKRYKRWYISLLFAFAVLVFNFPALIFYLIIRPEENWEDLGLYEIDHQHGGVNVPVINFVGTDGKVQLSLNLTVAPHLSESTDMTVDVGWNSTQTQMQPLESKLPERQELSLGTKESKPNAFENRLESLKSKASMSLQSMRSKAGQYSEELNEPVVETLTQKQKGKKKGKTS